MNRNQMILIAVAVVAAVIVAGAAVALSGNGNKDQPAPEPTGLSGTYTYSVVGSSTDPTVTYGINGSMQVILENGSSSFGNLSMSGGGNNPPGWAVHSTSYPAVNTGAPDSSALGQKNAMLNGVTFKEKGTADYDGSSVDVSIYTKTATAYTQSYYADASGVVYKVVTSDGTFTLTYTLTAISSSV